LYDANDLIGRTDKSALLVDYISIIKDGAGVGRVRRLPKNSCILGTMGAIIPQNIDYDFLFSVLEKTDFTKLTSGGTIPHIYFNQYGEKYFFVPSLEEQVKIGAYFFNLDHLITLHQRKVDNLKILKKFMLKKMFV
jgi:type I restriction enzyme S subunit